MNNKYLVILEVSQKQGYIFNHKRLQNNIIASDVIRYVTNPVFFKRCKNVNYSDDNLVYDGGGHSILEFPSKDEAERFVKGVTKQAMIEFAGIELFGKIMEYDETKTPIENEENLIKLLEEKKSIRRSSFKQGRFGIEASFNDREDASGKEKDMDTEKELVESIIHKEDIDTEKYYLVKEFEELGGTKNESNFIAVVHIDGNLMGKRVSALKGKAEWNEYKSQKSEFSKNIDADFKKAYEGMIAEVSYNLENENLMDKLDLKIKKEKIGFPVRKVITAGDDICFVTEGRIGIECARIFLEKLNELTNKTDQKKYTACAGVAIVHQKYPFYKAYEMAEELCSNAKRYIASLAADEEGDMRGIADLCAIDWHIEFGEMSNGLSQIRKQYRNEENYHLEGRPYWICPQSELTNKDPLKNYYSFRKCMKKILSDSNLISTGKLKEMRTAFKGTEESTKLYMDYQCIGEIAWYVRNSFEIKYNEEGKNVYSLYFDMHDNEKHALLFDMIELMDTFIELKNSGAKEEV